MGAQGADILAPRIFKPPDEYIITNSQQWGTLLCLQQPARGTLLSGVERVRAINWWSGIVNILSVCPSRALDWPAGENNRGWGRMEGGVEEKNLSLKPQSSHLSMFFPTRHLLWVQNATLVECCYHSKSLFSPETWNYLLSWGDVCVRCVLGNSYAGSPREYMFARLCLWQRAILGGCTRTYIVIQRFGCYNRIGTLIKTHSKFFPFFFFWYWNEKELYVSQKWLY